MKQDSPVIELRNVSKHIGKKTIIDQLTFSVPRGEVFGFLGPNGAGKTTTIRMMVGLMSITEGEIIINGDNVAKNFEKAIYHVGAIVENPEMYKFMSGYHNLLHYARMIPGVTKERIDEVVQLVGMGNRIKDKVKSYSLGMRQRLGVAQALLHKPSLLILDEPTNGLDPAGIRELRDYLRQLTRDEGISVVVSSHLLSEMELMCDRVAIIQNGKLIDIRLIEDEVNEEKLHKVKLEVNDAEKAQSILMEMYPDMKLEIQTDTIEVTLLQEQIPIAIEKLVQSEVKIYGVTKTKRTLEDRFLEVTGGEQIV